MRLTVYLYDIDVFIRNKLFQTRNNLCTINQKTLQYFAPKLVRISHAPLSFY